MAMGLNLGKSSVAGTAEYSEFKLSFDSAQWGMDQVSATGFTHQSGDSMKLKLSFRSALMVADPKTGVLHKELFQFDLSMETNHLQTQSSDSQTVKEDINHFAGRIVNAVGKLAAQGKDIDGLVLDQDDLKELAGLDHGKFLKKLLAIILMLNSLHRMRGQNGEGVILHPVRERSVVNTSSKSESFDSSCSLSVSRVVTDETACETASTPTEAPIEAPAAA